MSRPTDDEQRERAEEWMLQTFGYRMRDYTRAHLSEPISVAVVEIDRVFKLGGVRELLHQWRSEDVLSNAGRKPYLDEAAALALILLQFRIGRYTLFSDMAKTVMSMSPRQREAIGIHHDDQDRLLYDRVAGAVLRLIALVDEFPGPKRKIPNREQFRDIISNREKYQEKCARNKQRMHTLFDAVLEGTWRMLPSDVRERWDGNVAEDATLVELLGKAGNPSSSNLDRDRHSINYDGTFYTRSGNHSAITPDDNAALKSNGKSSTAKVTDAKGRKWGVEAELVRIIPNADGTADFPLITIAGGAHKVGEIVGEGARLAQSLHDRGHRINHWVVDRLYSNGKPFEFQLPIRHLGGKLVFDYQEQTLGVMTHTANGFIMVSGRWFLDNLPNAHRECDAKMRIAENAYDAEKARVKKLILSSAEKAKKLAPAKRRYLQALKLYDDQLAEREKYMLKPKGKIAPDGTRRYLIPTDAPGYNTWKAKDKSHQGRTVSMELPTDEELAKSPRAGGIKDEQYYHFGTEAWRKAYALRNTVESANANAKRSQFEDLADPNKRSARGNTFTYIVIALALVAENLRQILTFFQQRLQSKGRFGSKTRHAADAYWQSPGEIAPPEVTPPPRR